MLLLVVVMVVLVVGGKSSRLLWQLMHRLQVWLCQRQQCQHQPQLLVQRQQQQVVADATGMRMWLSQFMHRAIAACRLQCWWS
jgi:hypothetical protein